jgi:hypothetical protein
VKGGAGDGQRGAQYFDENASTRCCAGVTRTLGIVPGGVKKFVGTQTANIVLINHKFA